MRVLVVAATAAEIPSLGTGAYGPHALHLLVTGVGMVATAAHVSQLLTRHSFDVAFNFGVCGSFDPQLSVGTMVHVVSDQFSELGAEDGDQFIPIDDLGLGSSATIINATPPVLPALAELPTVHGITVNTVHGEERSIAAVVARCQPQVESMEGAAFAYSCALAGVPYAQVRAVSNVVERRNRAAWRLDLAVQRLNLETTRILDQL